MVKSPAQPDALVTWMGALADPTRLRLLRLLERYELGVAELCAVVQMPQSTVSRHLKVLADQGWLRNRRQGTTSLYRMILDELDAPARRLWLVARAETAPWAAVEQDGLRLKRVLAARDKDSQAFFAGAAGQWDQLRDELYGRSFTTAALLALLPRTWTVADLGCGTGVVAAEVARSVKRVIGVDQSAAMLRAARKRTSGLGNVELKKGDLADLPLDDASCDAALLVLVLTYVPDIAAVLGEAARVLRPGGTLVIVDLLEHDREEFRRHMGQRSLGFTTASLTHLLTGAGLHQPRIRPLPPEADAKGPALLLATVQR